MPSQKSDKKGVLTRIKIKIIFLTKKFFLIVIKITVFFIINFGNQELIYHINCFECIFYHQRKTRKFSKIYNIFDTKSNFQVK